MPDDSIQTERRLSAIEAQLHDNIATRAEQEQEFLRLLIERVGEVLNDFRATEMKEADARGEREFQRYAELQRQIDARFDNFGGEIDIIKDTHFLTQGLGTDVQQLVSEVQTLRLSQDALSSEFRQIGERLSEIETWRQEVDADRVSFKQSRDESKRERAELRTQYQESKEDRAALHQQLTELSTQVEQLSGQIAEVLAERRRGSDGTQ